MSGGSTADHEALVRALERFEIADARAKLEMKPSVHVLAIKRLIQLRTAALPCGWDEMAESLEDFAKRRVEAFLRMQGPIHSHQPEVGVPGEPAALSDGRFGIWTTHGATVAFGIVMVRWVGEAVRGYPVWWNETEKTFASAPFGNGPGTWKPMPDWEVADQGLFEGLARVIIR